MLFGLGLDALFDASHIDPVSLVHMEEHGGIIAILSSIVLWGFVLWFMVKPYFTQKRAVMAEAAAEVEQVGFFTPQPTDQ